LPSPLSTSAVHPHSPVTMKLIIVLAALAALLVSLASAQTNINPFMHGIYFADNHVQDIAAAGALLAGGLGTLAIGAKYINSGLPQAFKFLQVPKYNHHHVNHEPIIQSPLRKVIRIPLVQHVNHQSLIKAPGKVVHSVVPVAEKVVIPEPETVIVEPEAEWYPHAELTAFPESQVAVLDAEPETVVVSAEPEVTIIGHPEAEYTVGLAESNSYGALYDVYGSRRKAGAKGAKGAAAAASRLSPVRAQKSHGNYIVRKSNVKYAAAASEEQPVVVVAPDAVEASVPAAIATPDLTKDIPRRR